MLVIDPAWQYRSISINNFLEEDWWPQSGGRVSKKVHFDQSNQIVWEADRYETGNTFFRGDRSGAIDREYFLVYYDYNSSQVSLLYTGGNRALVASLDANFHFGKNGYEFPTIADAKIEIQKIFTQYGLTLGQP